MVTVQRRRLREGLRPNPRAVGCLPSPTPDHRVTKAPFTAVPFTRYIVSGYQTKDSKAAPQSTKHGVKRTEQAPEPDSDVAGMLELRDREFKTTGTVRPKVLKAESRQHARADGQREQGGGHSENQKEMLGTKNKKHCTGNEECL